MFLVSVVAFVGGCSEPDPQEVADAQQSLCAHIAQVDEIGIPPDESRSFDLADDFDSDAERLGGLGEAEAADFAAHYADFLRDQYEAYQTDDYTDDLEVSARLNGILSTLPDGYCK